MGNVAVSEDVLLRIEGVFEGIVVSGLYAGLRGRRVDEAEAVRRGGGGALSIIFANPAR